MPVKMAKTAPPMTGKRFPRIWHGMAIARQTHIPGKFLVKKDILVFLLNEFYADHSMKKS